MQLRIELEEAREALESSNRWKVSQKEAGLRDYVKGRNSTMAFEDIKTEFKVGPLTINLRILLEPKGFMKIILLVSGWVCGKEVVATMKAGTEWNAERNAERK